MKSFVIAVIGATGVIGREIINILYERGFPVSKIIPLASMDSYGKKISFGEKQVYQVEMLEKFNTFSDVDIVFFATNEYISRKYVDRFRSAGCIVIDTSDAYRLDEKVPLIVPEINAHDVGDSRFFASPNCSAIQLLMSIFPLTKLVNINRIFVSTYQSVSGIGRKAMNELYDKTKASYSFIDKDEEESVFPENIVFNCLPHVGDFDELGNSSEENKIKLESNKITGGILSDIIATCVRVPVFIGHAQSIFIEFDGSMKNINSVIEAYDDFPGVDLFNDVEKYATPLNAKNFDDVVVSRLRIDEEKRICSIWSVADNLRKGGALNAVQIAEIIANL
ncbi:aspartate-semialdehyde dehydrogenase [Anaplasmataceae bacterium AB001_6]|nr:aspartate-semialdehyde dehydrogenase [Anaplasmataceae bacterium AB001_6]